MGTICTEGCQGRNVPTQRLRAAGTTFGIAGALLLALNVPASGWGYVLFLAGSAPLLALELRRRDAWLAAMWAIYTAINALGVCRWLT